jgi:hypothetical protein
MYTQLAFALDRLRALAPDHPEWAAASPALAAAAAGDLGPLLKGGLAGLMELVAATHAGMTNDAFVAAVEAWIADAKHPRFGRPYTECVYQPMLEVMELLRARGFQVLARGGRSRGVRGARASGEAGAASRAGSRCRRSPLPPSPPKVWIVSGGGVEFMRPWTGRVYGVPPERVVGSHTTMEFSTEGGAPALKRLPKVGFVDDGPGKPVAINLHIGRRPIAAFGNSDGDFEMLLWTTARGVAGDGGGGSSSSSGDGAAAPQRHRLGVLLHHTDAAREFAYDKASHCGKLDRALEAAGGEGWVVVDIARDWARVFPWEPLEGGGGQ